MQICKVHSRDSRFVRKKMYGGTESVMNEIFDSKVAYARLRLNQSAKP